MDFIDREDARGTRSRYHREGVAREFLEPVNHDGHEFGGYGCRHAPRLIVHLDAKQPSFDELGIGENYYAIRLGY